MLNFELSPVKKPQRKSLIPVKQPNMMEISFTGDLSQTPVNDPQQDEPSDPTPTNNTKQQRPSLIPRRYQGKTSVTSGESQPQRKVNCGSSLTALSESSNGRQRPVGSRSSIAHHTNSESAVSGVFLQPALANVRPVSAEAVLGDNMTNPDSVQANIGSSESLLSGQKNMKDIASGITINSTVPGFTFPSGTRIIFGEDPNESTPEIRLDPKEFEEFEREFEELNSTITEEDEEGESECGSPQKQEPEGLENNSNQSALNNLSNNNRPGLPGRQHWDQTPGSYSTSEELNRDGGYEHWRSSSMAMFGVSDLVNLVEKLKFTPAAHSISDPGFERYVNQGEGQENDFEHGRSCIKFLN